MTRTPDDNGQPTAYSEPQPGSNHPYWPVSQDRDPHRHVDPGHYGRVGVVPWTFAQTLIGTALTLVPWILFIVASQLLVSQSATALKPLPRSVDVVTAIVT